MNDEIRSLSPVHQKRFEVQGFTGYDAADLYRYRWGIRLAYYLCDSIVILGLVTGNTIILAIALIIAFFGMILPNHPLDYLYNGVIRHWFNNPKLPPRSSQVRFACLLATIMIGSTIYLLSAGFNTAGLIVGFTLVSVATLVATTDICIPSMIYNRLFPGKG